MNAVLLRFWVLAVAGWIRGGQQDVVEYLVAENRILREQLGGRRLRLTDNQRQRGASRVGPCTRATIQFA